MSLLSYVVALVFFSVLMKSEGVIVVDPPGPLYLPIFMQQNVSCSADGGGVLTRVTVIFSSGHAESSLARAGRVIVPGIETIYSNIDITTILISVRTSNTSITALRCIGEVDSGSSITNVESTLNLTIYGTPDAPIITSLSLEGNSLRSSWDYVRIPTVYVTLHWSLSFFRLSQLSNMTTTLLNTNTYNYTLQGVRSCDPFRLCVRAENVVGNSSWSCNESVLPYLPQSEDIEFFLVQVTETFSLNVTVMVHDECQSTTDSYCLTLTSAEPNEDIISSCVGSDNGSSINLSVENLKFSSFYNFTIVSNNSIGQQSTTAASFCTNDIRGINVCPSSLNDKHYTISCDYVSGCNFSGCSYNLTSMTDTISGKIEGSNSAMIERNKVSQKTFHLTVRDLKGVTVKSENITFNDNLCPTTATTITSEGPSGSGAPSLSGRAIAAIAVVLLAAIVLVVAIIVTICLTRLGYCRCCGIISEKQQNNHESKVKFKKNGEGLPDVAIGSGNQRGNVPDVAMNADQQDEVSSQEPFYSSLNTTKPATVKVATPVTTAGGDYAKINQEPVYHVLENDGQNKAPPKEVILADEDAPPVPEYNPIVDVPAASPAPPPPVGGDISTSSAQPEAMYAEISTRSAAKL